MVEQVRKIKPTRRSVSGVYAFRGETSIQYESALERDFISRVEFFNSVLDVIPQPCEIPFTGSNGRTYTYTPDFLVYYHLGSRTPETYPKPMLVEVKPESEWRENGRTWYNKWKAAYRYAKEQGWIFRIHDESRIRDSVFYNIKFLERYKTGHFPEDESMQVLETVKQMGCTPLHYLLSRHFMGIYRTRGVAHIYHLLASRQLDCDMSKPLDEYSELWVSTYE